ncbi:LCP family protein [Saccharothrix sp. HUAS TT1]|uniref:LCP family glycopolymer transferase n=1 Tax=unclassified Saccharothrix TaxID=2593673 RepID=UPI00345BF880
MTGSRQEALIREAIAAEADQAVDHRAVLAGLRDGQARRRRPFALFAAAGLTAAAAVVAVVVPLGADRGAAPDPAATGGAPGTVLLAGLDDTGNTDLVVLARVGPDGTTSAASVPRDSLVDVPGGGVDKVSAVFRRARSAAEAEGRDGAAAGAEALVAAVESLTGVEVDHHATVDTAGFTALAEAVDGVDVCLRAAARDEHSGVDLPAGPQTVRGAQVLAFLRQRHGLPGGDLDRIARHQAFLRSVAAELAGDADPAALARVVDAVRDNVRTDPGWDLAGFARRLGPTVRTATIPVEGVADTDRGQGLVVDPAAVREFMAGFFADDAPADTPTSAPAGAPTDAPTDAPSDPPVDTPTGAPADTATVPPTGAPAVPPAVPPAGTATEVPAGCVR